MRGNTTNADIWYNTTTELWYVSNFIKQLISGRLPALTLERMWCSRLLGWSVSANLSQGQVSFIQWRYNVAKQPTTSTDGAGCLDNQTTKPFWGCYVWPYVQQQHDDVPASCGSGEPTRSNRALQKRNHEYAGRCQIPHSNDGSSIHPWRGTLHPCGHNRFGCRGREQSVYSSGLITPSTKGWKIMRTKYFLNSSVTDTILSPEEILYSHPDLHRWEQQGYKGNNPGWLQFFTSDDRLLLSLHLKKRNHLYYYEYNKPTFALSMVDAFDTSYDLSSFLNVACNGTDNLPEINKVNKVFTSK